jgi:hypothetical protein
MADGIAEVGTLGPESEADAVEKLSPRSSSVLRQLVHLIAVDN